MGIDVDYQARPGIIMARAQGALTESDLFRFMENMFDADPRIRNAGKCLNFLGVTDIQMNYDSIAALSNFEKIRRKGATPVALIVQSPYIYGFCHMYKSLAAMYNPDVRIFESENEALLWIRQALTARKKSASSGLPAGFSKVQIA